MKPEIVTRVADRYILAEYNPSTLDILAAGIGLLVIQGTIVSNSFFSEAEIKRYLTARKQFHQSFSEACLDLAQEIKQGTFGTPAMPLVRALQRIGTTPANQSQRALRLLSRALRDLKRVLPELEGDIRLRRLIFLAQQLTGSQYHTGDVVAEFIKNLLRLQTIPTTVRTLLRKALKFIRRDTTFSETANPGAWFEMSPEVQQKISDELARLDKEKDAVWDSIKDPEQRQVAYRAVLEKMKRLQEAAGVNTAIIQKGPKSKEEPLEAVLKRESKNLADGPTEFILTRLEKQLRSNYSDKDKVPREIGKLLTQLKKARSFDTMKRVLREASDRKLITSEWIDTLENWVAEASRNLAVKKGVSLTPLKWKPLDEEAFQAKHSTGRIVFQSGTPEKARQETLGRVSRALEDLESIFGKGFAGKHSKPLEFQFEGATGLAAASYFAYDKPQEWQPRVRFGEDYEGLLAHELSHFFDDLLADKIRKAKDPEGYAESHRRFGPLSRDLFGSTGVDLEYIGKRGVYGSDVIPELDDFVHAVLKTPDFARWKDMTGSAHDTGVTKAIEKLTGTKSYELPKDHPYYRYLFDAPRYKSEWDPVLLEATEKAYKEIAGDSRKLTYYNSGVEVWARMVEQYVATKLADQGVSNPWLTQLSYDVQDLPQMMDQETFEREVVPVLDRLFARIKEKSLLARMIERYATETLSKEWVMGVRRGWLRLMKPRISDYVSVLRAHDALDQFVEGLRDQIKYVRRGPTTRQTGKLWPKINAQFEELLKAINDSKNKAQHWKDYIDGKALSLQWGEDRSDDARKMLELYKSNFADATGTTVKLRGERWKGVDLTYLMDQILKLLREDAKNLTEWGLDKPPESVYKEFDLHGMKIVMDDSTLLPSEIKDYIKYFDEAYQRLKQKGFGKVWYGTLFVKCNDCGGTNQYGPELGVGGNYPIGPDKVNVFSRPSKYIVTLVAHELGHRYWFKLLSSTQRERFKDLIEIKKRPPNYEPKLYTTADAQAAKAGVEAAYEPLRKDLKAFGSSKVKWWPNLLKKFEEPLIKAGHNTLRDLIPVLSKVWPNASLPEIKALHTDALEANGVLTKGLSHMDQTIKGEIHALPEPATAPEDLDAYWAGIFKPIQKKWIEDILQKVDAGVAAAYIYIDAAVQANNEAEQEIAARLQRNWEEQSKELAKKVPPVSDYGEKHIDEAFAEVFAYYVMGKNMTQDQIESFKAVVKTATASRVASRYLGG